jgi:protease I
MARIAFLVDELFEDAEFRVPYDRLKAAGHELTIVGLEKGKQVEGKRSKERIRIERAADECSAGDFDALVIPGGYSPDKLRVSLPAVRLTREMFVAEKPVAAVCHAPWMLVEADVLDGKVVTSWPSIRTDLINAGARWVDREVVEDGNLVTSRKPDDLEAFTAAIERQLEGERRAARGSGDQPAAPLH